MGCNQYLGGLKAKTWVAIMYSSTFSSIKLSIYGINSMTMVFWTCNLLPKLALQLNSLSGDAKIQSRCYMILSHFQTKWGILSIFLS